MPERQRAETPSNDEASQATLLADLGERRHYKPATKAKHLMFVCVCATVGEHRRFRYK